MNGATLTAAPETLTDGGRLAACVGAVALVSLLAFEAMAVAAAMPAIAQALDGLALYALAFGGLLATSVLGMVLAGRSCDRHGAFLTTAIGLVVFAAGLLLAGLAGSMAGVVAGRIVQGLGSGMLGVALYVGMGQLVPRALHPRLFALLAAAWVLPALLGPPIAAWLAEHVGWRAVFLLVAAAAPPAAALLLPALRRLPRPAAAPGDAAVDRAPMAWAGMAALGALLLHGAGRTEGPAWPMLALGIAAVLAAARRLLPRGALVAAPGLPAVIALRGLLAASFASAEAFIPLVLTREAGWSLARAGLVLSAGAVLWSCGSALQARIAAPGARRRALQAGFAALAFGIGLVALVLFTGRPAWIAATGWALAGFGIGLAFPMLSVLTLSLSSSADQGRHAAALQLSDALCSSALLAVAGAATAQGTLRALAFAMTLALVGALLGRRAFA